MRKKYSNNKIFDALEWIATMASHVSSKGELMVRYYGYYSNVFRGKRKKGDNDELIPSILLHRHNLKLDKQNALAYHKTIRYICFYCIRWRQKWHL